MTVESTDEIQFTRIGRAGVVTLNRPQALNALNRSMCIALHRQLIDWAGDPAIGLVIVEGAGDRAFCAGGDIIGLHRDGKAGSPDWEGFFHDEYRMNQAIFHYPKPYVALLDGFTMGGGVGISIHAPYRVATERMQFAMPETGIGLITDVGATHALPLLPGELGTWLGLTGARLPAADCRAATIATHFAEAEQLSTLKDRLAHAHESVDHILATFDSEPGPGSIEALRDGIDFHFGHDSVEAILDSLDTGDDWALAQAALIRAMSPTSLKLTLHGLREGKGAAIEQCLKLEYRMVSGIKQGHDFYEGVRATLIDRDKTPRWSPAALADVDLTPYLEEPAWGDLDFD